MFAATRQLPQSPATRRLIQSMQFHPIYLRSILILSFPVLASGLFSSALPTSNQHARPLSLLACHMPRPSHPPLFDHADNVGLHQPMLSISISISLTYTRIFRCCFCVHRTVIKGNYFSFLKKVLVKLHVAAKELSWKKKNLVQGGRGMAGSR